MQEVLKKPNPFSKEGHPIRIVHLYFDSLLYPLDGDWQWDMASDAVFCSDVMLSLPFSFHGTKCLLHPDDRSLIQEVLEVLLNGQKADFTFRIITTYGEVRTLSGAGIQLASGEEELPHPETVFLQQLQANKDLINELEDLRQKQRAFENAEQSIKSGSWYFKYHTQETYFSDEVYRIYGVPPQGLNAQLHTFQHFIHTDDQSIVVEAFDRAFHDMLPLHLEYRVVLLNGIEKTIRQQTRWVYQQNGELLLLGSIQDISTYRTLEEHNEVTERTLIYQKVQLQWAEQATQSAFWTIDLLTRKSHFSDNYFRLLGLRPQSVPLSQRTMLNYVHLDDREVVSTFFQNLQHKHAADDIEYRLIRPDGKVRHVQQSGKLITGPLGELVIHGILKDVSLTKVADKNQRSLAEALELSQAINHEAEEISKSGTWWWNMDTENMQWSNGFYHLLGYKPQSIELSQKYLENLIFPEDRKAFLHVIDQTIQKDMPGEISFRITRNGTARHLKASFHLFHNKRKILIGTFRDITSEVEMQQELLERIGIAELLTENILDRVMITDQDNNIVLWNRECERMYQLKKEQVLQRNFFDVLPELRHDEKLAEFQQVLKGEALHKRAIRSKLHKELYDLHMIPLRDDNKSVSGILHIVHDVTKEAELRDRLEERLSFIEQLVESSVDRIIVLDRNMNYVYWNKRSEEYYNIAKENIIGKNILDTFPFLINDPTYKEFKKALQGETIYLPANPETNERNYADTYLIPLKNDRGHITGLLWMVRDKSQEYQLRKEQQKAEQIINTIDHIYFELDKNARLLYVNQKAELFWNQSKEALLGHNIWELFPKAVQTGGYQLIQQALEKQQTTSGDYYSDVVHRWIHMIATPSHEGVIVMFYDIDDTKRAQEKVLASEQLLRQSETIGHTGSYKMDIATGQIYFSDGMYLLFGEEPQSFVPSMAFIDSRSHPEDAAAIQKILEEAISKQQSYSYLRRIYGKDGNERIIEVHGQVVCNENGEAVQLLGMIQDITESKKAEDQLRENALFIEKVMDATPDFVMVFDMRADQVVYINHNAYKGDLQRYQETMGLDRTGLLQRAHPEDVEKVRNYMESFLHDEEDVIREVEYRVVKDGEVIWYNARGKVFKRDTNDKPLQYICIIHDISEEVSLRDQLSERTQYAESLIESSVDRMFVLSRNFTVLAWNRKCEEYYGVRSEQILGKNYLDFFPKVAENKEIMDAIKKAFAGEYTYVSARQEIYINTITERFYTPLFNDEQVESILCVLHDVTRLIQSQEELNALNQSLERKNKELESKHEEIASFAFVASHDLKEPLRKIHTFSDWLLHTENDHLSKTGKDYLKRIKQSVKRVDSLIEDILVLTKIHADRRHNQNVDLNDILLQVRKECKNVIKQSGAKIEFDILPVVIGNENQLLQLFRNLISNAIKFHKKDIAPEIYISCEFVAGTEEAQRFNLDTETEYAKITFADNGIGFDPKYSKKIFQVFQRLHNQEEYQGTGMGLAICRKIMENHGGIIEVEAASENGSSFACYFPLY